MPASSARAAKRSSAAVRRPAPTTAAAASPSAAIQSTVTSFALYTLCSVASAMYTEDPELLPQYLSEGASEPYSLNGNLAWPHLSPTNLWAIVGVNIGSFIFTIILLRVIWPPPTPEAVKQQKEIESKINELQQSYLSLADRREVIDVYEGESAGDYSLPWKQTFDLTFVIMMAVFLAINCAWTAYAAPQVWGNIDFWLEQLAKFAVMCTVSCIGGVMCKYFCDTDEKGYIITNKNTAFKVNYTRKLQHFAAYLVPLALRTKAAASVPGPLSLAWGNWFTMLSFLILIKPIRERFSIVMLQFNSLDRPEDRPNTLNWIIGGNILPGALMVMFFRWLYSFSGQQDLTYIFVFITGIGDGLAEPVGIYLGKHKYWTKGIGGGRRYQRSLEGSACVWLSSTIFISLLWYTFASAAQFWVAMVLLPPLMAYSEATSPHTIDTPFLMGIGGLTLWLISHVEVLWL